MNFATYDFWKVLILCFISSRLLIAIASRLIPQHETSISKLCLLATALILLHSESPLTLIAFSWVVCLGWLCVLLQGSRIHGHLKSTLFLTLLAAQLAPLIYFKYWHFVLNQIFALDFAAPSIFIPMGLSFYTFQTIGFWVDQNKSGKPRPSFIDYLNFSSFFPQIVAGPIEKRDDLLPQIQETPFKLHLKNLDAALQWIILGLAYKLIVADNIGNLSEELKINPLNAWHVWFECLAFGIRIYFDFAGYSFIAIGLGLLFGINLTLNFRSPYWSRNLRDFWRNWHVTLGAWLRDYIYVPLGGKKAKWWQINILIVFLVSGIWHGAGWGFIIWGLLHGLGIVICSLKLNWLRPAFIFQSSTFQYGLTFIYVTATWLFFFETNEETMWRKAHTAITPQSYSIDLLKSVPQLFDSPSNLLSMATVIAIAFTALALEGIGIKKQHEHYQIIRKPIFSLLLIVLIVLLAPMEESSFIYFNF